MRIVRSIGIFFAVAIGFLVALTTGARFADGPVGAFPGGPLERGERVVGGEPEWSFVRNIDTVELQLNEPPRSRTTWILDHEGRIYIPCGFLNSTLGRLWKKWPIEAEKDGRAVLRIDGKLYDRQLVRLEDQAIFELLAEQIRDKYEVSTSDLPVEDDALWIFELAPRTGPQGSAGRQTSRWRHRDTRPAVQRHPRASRRAGKQQPTGETLV